MPLAVDHPQPPPVCVLGLGLIGGSLLRAAGAVGTAGTAYGWSPTEETRNLAAADGFDVAPSLDVALLRALRDDALVVLAAPLTAFDSLLRRIGQATPSVRLTDVASVKLPVLDQVETLAPKARYVGSHPMAGTTGSGWSTGNAELFDHAVWVTCLTDSTPVDDWAGVANLALAVGSRVVPADAAEHDAAVARISHLPHLLALTLAQVGAQGGRLALELAAGSFADGTRVAATRPELIRAMTEANRDALIDALDDALGLLGVSRAALASTGSLERLTTVGHQARLTFEQRSGDLHPAVLSGTDLVEQLLAVGASGGHITGLQDRRTGMRVNAMVPGTEDH